MPSWFVIGVLPLPKQIVDDMEDTADAHGIIAENSEYMSYYLSDQKRKVSRYQKIRYRVDQKNSQLLTELWRAKP